jgi:hypothetical protein
MYVRAALLGHHFLIWISILPRFLRMLRIAQFSSVLLIVAAFVVPVTIVAVVQYFQPWYWWIVVAAGSQG